MYIFYNKILKTNLIIIWNNIFALKILFNFRHIAPRSGKPTGKITLGGFDKSNCENPLFSVPIPLYIPSSTGVNLYGTQVLG
jgi:hypothetical protein